MAHRSLTRDEAVRRAALIDVASYDVALAITDGETFSSRSVVHFGCAEPGATTFVELAGAEAWTATLNGTPVPAEAGEDNRIRLVGLLADNELVVEATLPCVTSGDGMHRYVDPADGAVYVSAYCGMDLAQRVFACFDQPDLKATIALTVTAPADWTVLSCGREVEREGEVRRFATTPPLPTYLFTVCAGPWHSVTWEHAGLPFGWHARRSMATAIDRDADELRRITEACFDHYTATFDEPFAFDSYDQVFAPGLNWGAMEFPGCVVYRDEMVHPGGLTDDDQMHRGMVIAHEMAHMWFGNLVTLRWWEDIWLNESFADYMGFQVAAVAAGFTGAWTSFTLTTEQRGYASDQRRSRHPVAAPPESVVDTDAGFANADMITYSKGNAALRQLVTWLGEETFLRGSNVFLTRHRFGNAQLDDFLAALDEVSDRDVRPWAQAWLSTTGFDTIEVRRDGDVLVVARTGSRPHRTRVAGYRLQDDRLVEHESVLVDLADDAVRLDGWGGLAVLPNSSDQTFARVRTDPDSWAALAERVSTIEDDQARSVVWGTALDLVHRAELHPLDLVTMAARHLAHEQVSAIWESMVAELLTVTLRRHVAATDLPAAHAELAESFARTRTGPDHLRLAATRAWVACTDDVTHLESWLADGRTEDGLPLDAVLRWRALARLAALGAVDVRRIDAEAGADPSTEAETGAARARASLPTPEAKAAAWSVLSADDVGNRLFGAVATGLWTPEQADLVAPYVDRYLAEAPTWAARRGQGFSQEISNYFPRHAVSEHTRDDLRAVLAGELPSLLARYWNDRLDDLEDDLVVRRARRTSR